MHHRKMPAATTSAEPLGMADPVATVRKYVDDFNRGDVKAMAADFARPASILDGLPPHVWQGPTAGEDWYRDVLAAGKQEGASEYFVTVDEPRHVDVTDDSAYVVVPATMQFRVRGTQVTQTGRDLYGRFAQTCQPLAHNCLGLGERQAIARCREFIYRWWWSDNVRA